VEHYFAGPLRNNILVDPPKPINQHLEKPLKNDRQMKGSMHDQPNIINISKVPQKSTKKIQSPATRQFAAIPSTETFVST
jgi:hypothetical protein